MDNDILNITDDDLLTIMEMRDNIYYGTFKGKCSDKKLAKLCAFTYYIVTDPNARYEHYVKKACQELDVKYEGESGMINFLKKNYNIEVLK